MQSNRKIETELIKKAVDSSWEQLVEEHPDLKLVEYHDLIKTIYGYGFIAGIYHGTARIVKLRQ